MELGEEAASSLLATVAAASVVVLVVLLILRRRSLLTGFAGALAFYAVGGYAFMRAVTWPDALVGEVASVAISVVLGAMAIFTAIGLVVVWFSACLRSMRHRGIGILNTLGMACVVGGVTYLGSWVAMNGVSGIREASGSRTAFLVVLGLFVLMCVLFASYVAACFLNMGSHFGRFDVVVVLGDELRHDDRLSWALAARVDKAVRAWRRKPGCVLVMSGAQGADEDQSRARAMAEYALLWDVPPEAILLDELSATTEESVANSIELVRAFRAGEIRMEGDDSEGDGATFTFGDADSTLASYEDEYAGVESPSEEDEVVEASSGDDDIRPEAARTESPAPFDPGKVLLVTTNCELLSALRAADRLGVRCRGVGAPCGPFTFLGRFGIQFFETIAFRA